MLRLDVWIVFAYRQALSVGEGLLKLGREFVEAHLVAPEKRAVIAGSMSAGVNFNHRDNSWAPGWSAGPVWTVDYDR